MQGAHLARDSRGRRADNSLVQSRADRHHPPRESDAGILTVTARGWEQRSPLPVRSLPCELAGLAVQGVLAVPRAELLQLEPVGVVAAVLAGDVVPLLALGAGQGDLRTDVARFGHDGAPRLVPAPL